MARLDRLPQVRELAQLGSVLGREFAYEMISGLSTISDATLQEGLGQLVERGTALPARPPASRSLCLQACIGEGRRLRLASAPPPPAISPAGRRALGEEFPRIVEAHPELLAHHYSEAGVGDRAIDYWQLAGQRAIERSANAEAISHLNLWYRHDRHDARRRRPGAT